MPRPAALLALGLVACGRSDPSPAPPPPPEDPPSDTDSTDGSEIPDASGDTGEPEPPPTVQCEDPGLRESLGPFERFTVKTEATSVPWTWGTGLLVADFDEDGTHDIWVTLESGIRAWALDPSKGLVEIPTRLPESPSELALHGGGTGGAIADYDGDGDLDVFVARYAGWPREDHAEAGVNRLFLNDGAKGFVDVTEEAGGLDGCFGPTCLRSSAASFGDIDGDGDLDLFVGAHGLIDPNAGSKVPLMGEPSRLYANDGDGTFSDISEALQEPPLTGLTLGGGMFDLDRDGDLDLYLVNDVGALMVPNKVLWNALGDGRVWIPEFNVGLGIEVDGMGLAVGDVNGDLVYDFVVAGWATTPYLESAAKFGLWADSTGVVGLTTKLPSEVAWGSAFLDVDNDGDLDLLNQFGWIEREPLGRLPQPDTLHLNVGTPTEPQFERDTGTYGLGDTANNRGAAVVDLNQDGWLDIIKASTDGHLTVDLARCGEAAWLELELEQPGTLNPDAIGAEIRVTEGEQVWTRTVFAGGTSFGVALPPEVHFGLGDVDEVDKVEVIWPDGDVSDLGPVLTRQRLTVVR